MTLTSEPCHTGGAFVVNQFSKKKDEQNLTLMTLDWELCHLVSMWLRALPLKTCQSGDLLYQKKMDNNLTLLNLHHEPCQLVLMWFISLYSEPCHIGGVLC